MIKLRNNKFLNKSELYLMIDLLRKYLGLSSNYLPLNSISLAYAACQDLVIEEIDFKTTLICGILYKGDDTTSIALNSNRSKIMQNFDCCHELIHYFCHDIKECQCICTEAGTSIRPITQISSFEWQANEGAAELLVPYKDFIPTYIELSRKNARSWYGTPPLKELSERYNVTETVIQNRISSLNYEIYQYMEHGDIDQIEILSQNKQKQKGWNKSHERHYCLSCLAPISMMYNYCPVCGTKIETEGLNAFNYILIGAGYMKYPGVELNESLRPCECPNCRNEEIENDSEYCAICGSYILNTCTNQLISCEHAFDPLPGNARYCPYCGAETTYLQNGFIEKVKDDTHKPQTPTDIAEITRAIANEEIPF